MGINVSLNNLSVLAFRIDPFVFPAIKVFHRIVKQNFLPPFLSSLQGGDAHDLSQPFKDRKSGGFFFFADFLHSICF